jgi:hypothetical protein
LSQAESSRALQFQDFSTWLVYEDTYSSRAMKCVFKTGLLKAQASSSSSLRPLIMLFEPSWVLDRAQARLLNFLMCDSSKVQVQVCKQPLYIYLKYKYKIC